MTPASPRPTKQGDSGTNLVLIEPDLTELFPDGESVNRALRLLADSGGSRGTIHSTKGAEQGDAADARQSRARLIATAFRRLGRTEVGCESATNTCAETQRKTFSESRVEIFLFCVSASLREYSFD